MDSIIKKAVDRINRIDWIFFQAFRKKAGLNIAFGEIGPLLDLGETDALVDVKEFGRNSLWIV